MIKNKVERIRYSGGLLGLLFGSSRGKLEDVVKAQNQEGWNLHFIHQDSPNILIWIFVVYFITDFHHIHAIIEFGGGWQIFSDSLGPIWFNFKDVIERNKCTKSPQKFTFERIV